MQPGEEAFDLPTAADASERTPVLRARAAVPIRGDHFDPIRAHQRVVERIAVVAAIADQPRGKIGEEAGLEGGRDEVRLIR
jgi:hypothetical protein